jgi:PKHD-type hydroxylase
MSWLLQRDMVENWAYWDDAFSAEECKKIIDYALQKPKEKGAISGTFDTPGVINSAHRNNSIIWIKEDDPNTKFVMERLTNIINELNSKYFKFNIYGFCEPLQFTEYNAPSEYYKRHIDKMYNGIIRKLSVVVQLTDSTEYEGGELIIYSGNSTPMRKTQGSVIIFPSYVLHEVTPVIKGTRHSLVAWLAGDPFK